MLVGSIFLSLVSSSLLMGCGNNEQDDADFKTNTYGQINTKIPTYPTYSSAHSFGTARSTRAPGSTTRLSTTITPTKPGKVYRDLPVDIAPVPSIRRCENHAAFHERFYVNGEGDIPNQIQVEVLSKNDINSIMVNEVGRWVDMAISPGGGGFVHGDIYRPLSEVISSHSGTDFMRFWHASHGPRFLAHIEAIGPGSDRAARCGAFRVDTARNANCFTFMVFVTNLPVPTGMKSRHVAKALDLDRFCQTNQAGLVAELERYRTNVRHAYIPVYGDKKERLRLSYTEGFAANWLAFCPNLVDAVSPEIRKMVFDHGVYRQRVLVSSRASNRPYRIQVQSRNSTLMEMLPMLLESGAPSRLLTSVDAVSFVDENGLGPGVITNWYEEMGRQIIGSEFGIFELSDNKKYAELKSKVLSEARARGNEDEMKNRLRAAGRFIGHIFANNRYFSTDLTSMFLARLTGKVIGFEALSLYETAAYLGYEMVYNDPDCGIDVPEFLDPAGVMTSWPSDQNARALMLDKLISNYVTKEATEEYAELSKGIFEIIPQSVFESGIKVNEIYQIIFGAPTIDVDDLFRNWDVSNFGSDLSQVVMLQNVLRQWSRDTVNGQTILRKFVEFVTGSSRVLAGGFGAYHGATGYRFTVIRRPSRDEWPRSHNCWNRLDLPQYSSQSVMETKLREAINNSDAFGIV